MHPTNATKYCVILKPVLLSTYTLEAPLWVLIRCEKPALSYKSIYSAEYYTYFPCGHFEVSNLTKKEA